MTTVIWKAENDDGTSKDLQFCIKVLVPDVIITGAARRSESTTYSTAFMPIGVTKGYRSKSFTLQPGTNDVVSMPALSLERDGGIMSYAVKQDGKILPASRAGTIMNDAGDGTFGWMQVSNIPKFDPDGAKFTITKTVVELP